VSAGLSVCIPDGSFTVIVGPNACGKSTLLRGLSRLLKPAEGRVVLDGRSIASYRAKEVARRLGLLPQSSIAPNGITVADLVAHGRYPHQNLVRQWTDADERAVLEAMAATGVAELSGRLVDELSGGQRQRVWAAMALAQQTPLLLLDEPTRGLDAATKAELVAVWRGWLAAGAAVLLVTHDVELAAMIADRTIMLSGGEIIAAGPTREVLGSSPHFAPQIARLFPHSGWLTPADVLKHIQR